MSDRVHRFQATCQWEGSTAAGYQAYDRSHVATSPPATERLPLSSDPVFLGDPSRLNPESLVLVAAASCQMLSFLAVAARARIDVTGYEDDAEAVMGEDDRPMWITEIRLRPRITVRAPATERRVHDLADLAHRECFIANSLRSQISVTPTVTIVEGAAGSE